MITYNAASFRQDTPANWGQTLRPNGCPWSREHARKGTIHFAMSMGAAQAARFMPHQQGCMRTPPAHDRLNHS